MAEDVYDHVNPRITMAKVTKIGSTRPSGMTLEVAMMDVLHLVVSEVARQFAAYDMMVAREVLAKVCDRMWSVYLSDSPSECDVRAMVEDIVRELALERKPVPMVS